MTNNRRIHLPDLQYPQRPSELHRAWSLSTRSSCTVLPYSSGGVEARRCFRLFNDSGRDRR